MSIRSFISVNRNWVRTYKRTVTAGVLHTVLDVALSSGLTFFSS